MIGILILMLWLFMLAFLLGLVQHATQSAILDLGNYTRAYRCKKCNSVYSGNQTICGTCGYENKTGMVREIGKWHRRISKLGVEYYWEPKNVQM